jgi:hypothetical protein
MDCLRRRRNRDRSYIHLAWIIPLRLHSYVYMPGARVGFDLHRLGQQDKVHLPHPNLGCAPMFCVVGPHCQCQQEARKPKIVDQP